MASEKKSNAAKYKAKKKVDALSAKKAKVVDKASKVGTKVSSGHVGGFMTFIREQGIVGLAVGLAIGTAAGDTVRKLVEGFINPIVQFIVGTKSGLEAAEWNIVLFGRSADFKWGAFVSSLITLIATAFVIYLIVHLAKLDRIDKKKDK